MLRMIFGSLALTIAALFTGAAVYINVAEHPARLKLEDGPLLVEWKPAYEAGKLMQASLAAAGAFCGVIAFFFDWDWKWIIGAALLGGAWPYTLYLIMPTNNRLLAADPAAPTAEVRPLMIRWGWLHAGRSVLGALATLMFFVAPF
jgi:hypothetical protein